MAGAAAFCPLGKHGAPWASRQESQAARGEPPGTAPLCGEGVAGGRRPVGRGQAPAVGLRSPAVARGQAPAVGSGARLP